MDAVVPRRAKTDSWPERGPLVAKVHGADERIASPVGPVQGGVDEEDGETVADGRKPSLVFSAPHYREAS